MTNKYNFAFYLYESRCVGQAMTALITHTHTHTVQLKTSVYLNQRMSSYNVKRSISLISVKLDWAFIGCWFD